MDVRRLAEGDWEANREIRLEALASHPGNYFTSLAQAEARSDDQWRALLGDPKMAIFGLFDGDALAGLTAIYIADADPRIGATLRRWPDGVEEENIEYELMLAPATLSSPHKQESPS